MFFKRIHLRIKIGKMEKLDWQRIQKFSLIELKSYPWFYSLSVIGILGLIIIVEQWKNRPCAIT
jgi:hypothetical protein